MMPGVALLSYALAMLLLLALLGAALLGSIFLGATPIFWQQAPARSKIPRAQKHREEALRRMEALAQRLRQQVSGHGPWGPGPSIPAAGPAWGQGPSCSPISFRRQGAEPTPQLCTLAPGVAVSSSSVWVPSQSGQDGSSPSWCPHRLSNRVGVHSGYFF